MKRPLVLLLTLSCMPAFCEAATLDLDNGAIKVRLDLNSGGAITYLSPSGSTENLINNYDRGRQIQQSYYAGQALNRIAEGQHPSWSPWPWNPIQVGDAFGHSSAVLESSGADGVVYTKTIPLLWDMNNEPAEALMEQWTRLDKNSVLVRCKLTCQRTDTRWNIASRHQEMPALYTISRLSHQFTYVGDAPWTHAPLTEIVQVGPPWTYWGPGTVRPGQIERWAANVDDSNWGVGVYYRDTEIFVGGRAGDPGGGEFDFATTYLAPLRTLRLDKNTTLEWGYDLIVGTLAQIRSFVYQDFLGETEAGEWDGYQ